MDITEYSEWDGMSAAALVRSGDVSASELVEAAISRIERHDDVLNAVVYRAFDEARAAARGALPQGPFTGVPMLVKDYGIGVAGWPNTYGSRFCRDLVDPHDSGLTARYRAGGAIPIGRGASSEFGIIGNVETAAHGAVRNPWNPQHMAGGSSGGSAAAVAAGYVPVAHASDGLGSIRIPAACCGLVGLKVTRDRNPNLPDGFDYAMGFVVDHVVTRSVRDSAAMLDVTGWPEPASPYASPPRPASYLEEVAHAPGRLRIGWSGETPRGGAAGAEVTRALAETARLLATLGHDVVEAPIPVDHRAIYAARAPVSAANFAAGIARVADRVGREPGADDFEPLTWASVQRSRQVTGEAAFRALQELRMLTRGVLAYFEEFDLFLCPVMTEPPPPIGFISGADGDPAEIGRRQAALFPYAALFNFTGQPSISLPLAMSNDGLPIGMMLTARYADETTLFRIAGQVEREMPWSARRPAIWN